MGQVTRALLSLHLKCENTAEGRFITLLVPPSNKSQTHVVKKTLEPAFLAESSTFDFPLYLSMASVVGGRGIEGVMWDKVGSLASFVHGPPLMTRI